MFSMNDIAKDILVSRTTILRYREILIRKKMLVENKHFIITPGNKYRFFGDSIEIFEKAIRAQLNNKNENSENN